MKSEKFLLYLIMALLAVFSFLFSLYAVNPLLHYHFQQIAWSSGNLFLNYYLAFSGGLGEYAGLFISQFFIWKVMGSAIVSFAGFLIKKFLEALPRGSIYSPLKFRGDVNPSTDGDRGVK